MNIPNALTTLRFFMIPAFVAMFYSPIENNRLYAVYIFLLAGLTDILDGYIARAYNMITKWGQALDPLADKLMIVTVLICMTHQSIIPIWVTMIIGVKEIVMILGSLLLYKSSKTVIQANRYGKIATVALYIAIVSSVLDFTYNIFLMTVALWVTIFAFVKYIQGFFVAKG